MWSLTHPSDSTLTSAYAKLAQLNPFRYRGYVWDEETGLYYLRSRYYDPAWGRFVNPDALLGTIGAVLRHNQFTYCYNNVPVRNDANGMAANNIVKNMLRGLVNGFCQGILLFVSETEAPKRVFAHWMFGEGETLDDETKRQLIALMKNSPALKRDIYRKYKKQGSVVDSGLEFPKSERDLNITVGHAEYIAEVKPLGGTYWVSVTISDTGDFGERRLDGSSLESIRETFNISNLANDVGTTIEATGLATTFSWEVSFQMTIDPDEL